jgi:ubiquinone/menaquinone biosynthesis C-methylase UbiE
VEAKVHRRVQRYGWDLAVEDYDRYFLPVLGHCAESCLDMVGLGPGERVLDVATGTGVAAFAASERVGPGGEVVATDISQKMVDAVREQAERKGVANMAFQRVDAEDLDFPDGSFDAVMCILGLMYPANPQRAIGQMLRVTKAGGRATAAVWGRRGRCGWASIFPIVDERVRSDVCPMFFQLGNPGALALAFETAGFTDLREERVDRTLEFKSAADLLSAMFAGGPAALAYSKFSDDVKEAVHAEFLDSVEEYRHGEGFTIPGEFVFIAGRRAPRAGG